MQPTPHAFLCNVGIQNHMTVSVLEEGLEQNHRLQFKQGVKVKIFVQFGVILLCFCVHQREREGQESDQEKNKETEKERERETVHRLIMV